MSVEQKCGSEVNREELIDLFMRQSETDRKNYLLSHAVYTTLQEPDFSNERVLLSLLLK